MNTLERITADPGILFSMSLETHPRVRRSVIRTRFALLAVSAVIAASAAGQNDIDFYPSKGPPAGGTEVHLRPRSMYSRFTAPQVFFDGTAAQRTTLVSASEIVAVTPPHAVGIVSVTVVDNGAALVSSHEFVFAPELEEILIPVALNLVDAGYGTRWISEVSAYNDSDDRVPIDPHVCYSFGSPYLCSRPVRWIEPHSSITLEPASNRPDQPAMFIRPPVDQADRLHFTVRLRELSRTPDDPGVQIPVVRARDFQRKEIWLPAVPTVAAYRSTLRIYTRAPEVTVRVKDDGTGETLMEQRIERPMPTDIDTFGTVTLHDLLARATIPSHDRVRIEVHAMTPVWAMLSLTDNDTQHVKLFTPQ